MDSNALALWNQFIESGQVTGPIQPVIMNSWQRCMEYKINYESIDKTEVLSSSGLMERLEETRDLVQVAMPVMEELYRVLRGLGFMVVLSDHEGYILKTMIDDGFKKQSRSLMLCEGANWNERNKGTNAIGTSLAEGNAVKVFASEHFVRENHILACAAVPIFDADGRIKGTLDVTGESKKGNERIFRMVSMSAKNIERELQFLQLHRKLEMYKARYDGLFDLMREGAIVVDEEGTVREISRSAGRVLGVGHNDYLGENIEELFNLNSMWVLDSSSQDSREITISPKHGSSLVTARARRIYGPDGKPQGLVALVDNAETREIGNRKTNIVNNPVLVPTDRGNVVRFSFSDIIGKSEYLKQVISVCKRVARNNSTVLLTGETGTGKEMLAQAIHQESSRSHRPFVAVNCAAIPAELIESELFGYEDGAFTGARKGGSPGKFEVANGGTIFLDEIGDMSPRAQVSLLRVLQEKQLCRVGGRFVKPIDVRVVAATHRNLTEMVEEGTFRQDLFFRLNVVNIYIPPLRNRGEDVELLAVYFLEKYKYLIGRPELQISDEAMEKLKAFDWPGNVREIENIIEGLVNMVEEDAIEIRHLPEAIQHSRASAANHGKTMTLKDIEKTAILQAIRDCSGSLSTAATKLGIGRSTLYRKLKEYEIEGEALFK